MDAKVLAKEYVRLHNLASKEFKEAFKKVGAKMWRMDNAHALRKENEVFISITMGRMITRGEDVREVYDLWRPLTILDSYPHVTGVQRHELSKEVDEILLRYRKQWKKFVRDQRTG